MRLRSSVPSRVFKLARRSMSACWRRSLPSRCSRSNAYRMMLLGCRRIAELRCLEVGSAVAVLDNGLTINDCRLAAEVGSGADDRWITVAPIISIAREDTRLSSLKHHLGAIAIVFDFVNPVLALWRLIDRGSKLWLDEPEPCRKH